ncbi:MAG: hypothetical protein LRZ84_05410 [Desertifilum sp.]|nr:hypothetical protein [Desertifilum sp.]
MTEDEIQSKHQRIRAGVKAAIAHALERHRKLGESIAVWQDGKVVVLSADQIPPIQTEDSYQEHHHD